MMRYQYQCKVRAVDFWALSMYRTYHSLVGVCNIVFGIAMILLTVRFWNQAGDALQAVLFFACLLIPVIQPLGVYLKAKARVSVIGQGTELVFAEDGIHVTLGGEKERIPWKKVRGIRKEAGIIIVYTDANHGYILTNHVLGSEKADFYHYVESHIKQHASTAKNKDGVKE